MITVLLWGFLVSKDILYSRGNPVEWRIEKREPFFPWLIIIRLFPRPKQGLWHSTFRQILYIFFPTSLSG
jgi:hypothetical protein